MKTPFRSSHSASSSEPCLGTNLLILLNREHNRFLVHRYMRGQMISGPEGRHIVVEVTTSTVSLHTRWIGTISNLSLRRRLFFHTHMFNIFLARSRGDVSTHVYADSYVFLHSWNTKFLGTKPQTCAQGSEGKKTCCECVLHTAAAFILFMAQLAKA